MKLNKKILVPVLSAILLFVKESTGYELPDGTSDLIADLLMLVVTSIGIPMSFKKHKFDDADNFE